jgi:hypothetical protein
VCCWFDWMEVVRLESLWTLLIFLTAIDATKDKSRR